MAGRSGRYVKSSSALGHPVDLWNDVGPILEQVGTYGAIAFGMAVAYRLVRAAHDRSLQISDAAVETARRAAETAEEQLRNAWAELARREQMWTDERAQLIGRIVRSTDRYDKEERDQHQPGGGD